MSDGMSDGPMFQRRVKVVLSAVEIRHLIDLRQRSGALLAVFLALLIIISALFFLPPAQAPEFRMTLLGGDSVRELGYDESTDYRIALSNEGAAPTGLIRISMDGVPAGWNASLSDRRISLDRNEVAFLILTVTAPAAHVSTRAIDGNDTSADDTPDDDTSVENSPDDESSDEYTPVDPSSIDQVAAITVRGGNVTVGTVTILRGSLERMRDGIRIALADRPHIVEPGDRYFSSGYSRIDVDLSLLFGDLGTFSGLVHLGLHDAALGFYRHENEAFVWLSSGRLDVLSKGIDPSASSASSTRALSDSFTFRPGRNESLDAAIPGLTYGGLLSFGPTPSELLCSLETSDTISSEPVLATVFAGSLEVDNSVDTALLEERERITGTFDALLPAKEAFDAIMVEVETPTGGDVVVSVDGTNIYDTDSSFILTGIDGSDHYAVASDDIDEQRVELIRQSSVPAHYRTSVMRADHKGTRQFETTVLVNKSAPGTEERITVTENTLALRMPKEQCSYDVRLTVDGDESAPQSFELNDIRTASDDQIISVIDWYEMPREEWSVSFSQGDVTVAVENGESGDSVLKRVDDEKGDSDSADLLCVWFAVILAVVLLLAFLYLRAHKDEDDPDRSDMAAFDTEDARGQLSSAEPDSIDDRIVEQAIMDKFASFHHDSDHTVEEEGEQEIDEDRGKEEAEELRGGEEVEGCEDIQSETVEQEEMPSAVDGIEPDGADETATGESGTRELTELTHGLRERMSKIERSDREQEMEALHQRIAVRGMGTEHRDAFSEMERLRHRVEARIARVDKK